MGLRRHLLVFACLALPGLQAAAQQPEWPAKPVRIVVASAPGGAPDLFARYYAEQLSKAWGKPVLVDNKPGAAGGLAAGVVATATDQHTLFWGFSSIFTINPHVYPRGAVDLRRDLVPVATAVKQGLMLVVNNDFPAKTLAELVRLARDKPGSLSFGSYGVAGYPHLAMEVLQDEAGMQMVHVPYKQGALIDVIGGQLPMVVEPISTAMPQIRAKKVRPIAYTLAQRLPEVPDVPTFAEVYPAMGEVTGIHGIWMPAGTPPEVLARANAAIGQVTHMPETAQRLSELSCVPYDGGTPTQITATLDKEYQRWGKLIRDKKIKLE